MIDFLAIVYKRSYKLITAFIRVKILDSGFQIPVVRKL